MSEELHLNAEPMPPVTDAAAAAEDEFEEITSDEVDRVVDALDELIESVESDNIRAYLEEAMNGIYFLIYDEDDCDADDDMTTDDPMSEAA